MTRSKNKENGAGETRNKNKSSTVSRADTEEFSRPCITEPAIGKHVVIAECRFSAENWQLFYERDSRKTDFSKSRRLWP